MTDKKKIRAEVERLMTIYGNREANTGIDKLYKAARLIGYKDVLNFIDSMDKEEEHKFSPGDVVRRKKDGLTAFVEDVQEDGNIYVRCEDWENLVSANDWKIIDTSEV